ncbi:MAG: ABC transporter permease, partial [Gemmatimonadales bacterium]
LTLSTVLAQTKDMAIGLVVMGLALPLFFGVSYHWTVLWVPLLLLLLLLITAAAGLFLACANLFFRDVKYLVQVFLTFGIFFTPIFFNASLLGGTAGTLVMLNPVAPILEGMYFAVVAGHNLAVPFVGPASAGGTSLLIWSPWSLVYSLMWGTVGLLASLLFFRRLSYLFAEYI